MEATSSESGEKEAHIRFLGLSNCILYFQLQYKSEDVGEINQEITAVRQENEKVASLLDHTKNKIIKLLQDNWEEREDKISEEGGDTKKRAFPTIDLKISLTNVNKKKDVDPECVLKNLKQFKNMRFNILDNAYKVVINAPLVNVITLPDIIYGGSLVQPNLQKAHLIDVNLSKHSWFRSKDRLEWELIGEKYKYQVRKEDVEYFLKYVCIPVNEFCEGKCVEVEAQRPVFVMPDVPNCPFVERQKGTPEYLNGNQFRVVTYNTLSCRYTHDQFEYCPLQYIGIDYRKKLIVEELLGYKADIICLQEVDFRVFNTYFSEKFKSAGYGCTYDKKGNRIPEGLALFYNKNRFSCTRNKQIVFQSEIKNNQYLRNILKLLRTDEETCDTFFKQATSMQYCKLKSKNMNQIVIVANTHLFYRPGADNVRLIQTALCVEFLKAYCSKEQKMNKNHSISVVFCGDFNSNPDSKVFTYLTKGAVQFDNEKEDFSTTIFHPFTFYSACGTPKYTNYTESFKSCLDYIFYDNLTLMSHLPLPDESILSENIAIPSRVYPSDHIALVADFKFQ